MALICSKKTKTKNFYNFVETKLSTNNNSKILITNGKKSILKKDNNNLIQIQQPVLTNSKRLRRRFGGLHKLIG